MSQLDRQGLISQSNALFPNNTQQEITPNDIRQFDLDCIDSFALTGSLPTPIDTGSFATTGSNTFNGNQTISGSVTVSDPSSTAFIVQSGPNDITPVIIEGGFNGIDKFTNSSIKGISVYGGLQLSGSWGEVGTGVTGIGSSRTGIYNHATSSTSLIALRHSLLGTNAPGGERETAYDSFTSKPSQANTESLINLKGTEITLQASTGSKQTSVTVDGDVSASVFTGSFVGDGSGLTGIVSASHAEFADNATSASHAEFSDDARDLVVTVKNTGGVPIVKGNVLHATGVTGENINVELADNTNSANMPGFAIANEAISTNATGQAIISGKIIGVNTNGLTAGTNVYVNASGGFTGTKPTGSSLIQNIGVVGKVDASDGELVVLGSGRSNDLPNIQEGYAWVGDSNGVPQAVLTSSFDTTVDTGSFATTGSNTFNGTQTLSAGNSLTLLGGNVQVTGSVDALGGLVSKQNMEVVNPSGNPYIRIGNTTQQYQFAGMEIYTNRTINPGNQYAGFTVLDTGNSMNGGININTYTGVDGSTPVFQLFGGGGGGGAGQTILAAKDDSTVEFFKYNKFNNTTELNNNLLCNGPSDFKQNMVITGSLTLSSGNAVNASGGTFGQVDSNVFFTSAGAPITFFNNVAISGSLTMAPNNPVIADAGVFANVNTTQIFSNTNNTQMVTPLQLSGKVYSDIQTVGISSNTASIDFQNTQMAIVTLPSSGNTNIATANLGNGQVMNVLVKSTGTGTVTLANNILQPSGSTYVATTGAGGRDMITLSTFDNGTTSEVYLVNVTKFE